MAEMTDPQLPPPQPWLAVLATERAASGRATVTAGSAGEAGNGPAPENGFYPASGHLECLERLTLAVRQPGGLAVVVGEPGFGKSILRQALAAQLAADDRTMTLTIAALGPARTDVQLLRALIAEAGGTPRSRSGLGLSAELRALAAEAASGEPARPPRIRILIDAAEELSGSQLELLRALLATPPAEADIGIVLFGQPEILDKIDRKQRLAQAVVMRHALNPFSQRDTAGLLADRVRPQTVTADALDLLYQRSGGVPGQIVDLSARLRDLAADHDGPIDRALVARATAGPEAAGPAQLSLNGFDASASGRP